MQPILKNKRMLLSASLLLAMSNASMATDGSFPITALTIQDIVITEEQAITFGQTITGEAGTTCSMAAQSPGEDILNADINGDGGALTTNAAFGTISGDGCTDGVYATVNPGVYKLKGEAGSAISIDLTAVDAGDFIFTPGKGCAVEFDGTTAADTCGLLDTTTMPLSVKLPKAIADESPAGPAAAGLVAGESLIAVGGVLSIVNAMTTQAGGYTATFDVTVTYE